MSTESKAIVFVDDARSLEFEAAKFEAAPQRAVVLEIVADVMSSDEEREAGRGGLADVPIVERQAMMLEINATAEAARAGVENEHELDEAISTYYAEAAHLGPGGAARVERFARSGEKRLRIPPPALPIGEDEQRCIDLADAWAQGRGVNLYKLGSRDQTHAREDLCLFLRRQNVKQRVVCWLLACHLAGKAKPYAEDYVRQLTRRAEQRAGTVGGSVA